MKKFAVFALFVLLGCQGCPASQPLPQPGVITDTDQCEPACANLRRLGCEEGQPVPNGDGTESTCEEYCHNTQDNGVWLNPTCVKSVTSCDMVEQCAVKKK